MGVAFWTSFSVKVLIEVLVDTALAKCIQALVDGVGIPKEAIAEGALEESVEISLFNLSDQCCLATLPQQLTPTPISHLLILTIFIVVVKIISL